MSLDSVINVRLITNPVNWAIVILMWMLGAMLLHVISMTASGQSDIVSGGQVNG